MIVRSESLFPTRNPTEADLPPPTPAEQESMKKYGLQLRIPPAQQQKKPAAPPPPLPRPSIFADDDDDDVEKEISRQASKNKAALKVEEQHKKALEEDPSVFDYDGVFDQMKGQIAKPRVIDRAQRQAKYIPGILAKSKERSREQDVIYERKLLKERSKDDHLFADKEKFITSAYKKKLAEEQKWLEEERLRQIREEKEDVTKLKDMSSFYFSLHKNVAFGAGSKEPTQENTHIKGSQLNAEAPVHDKQEVEEADARVARRSQEADVPVESTRRPQDHSERAEAPASRVAKAEQDSSEQKPAESIKKTEDAVAAARERYLARKRARQE